MQSSLPSRHRSALAGKLLLLGFFLLGVWIIFYGLRGMQEYAASGFSSETAYQAIYHLHRETETAWNRKLSPQLKELSAEEQLRLRELTEQLASSAWEKQKKGGGAMLAELLSEEDEDEREALAQKLLYATYLVNGPKVSTANRKTVTALSGDEAEAFRLQLLRCLCDEAAELPPAAQKLAGDLSGEERAAMLIQIWYVSNGSADSGITEQVNTLKKTVRDKSAQLDAFRMIARC